MSGKSLFIAAFGCLALIGCSDGTVSDEPDSLCGNGVISPGEVCDDGNTVSGDGCAGNCQLIESGYECAQAGAPCTVVDWHDYTHSHCGDGNLNDDEACDDNNRIGGDGCSADCKTIEPGYRCPAPGDLCVQETCVGDGCSGTSACQNDNQCAETQICTNSLCTEMVAGQCKKDTQCGSGQTCNTSSHSCESNGTGCQNDDQCGDTQICINSVCTEMIAGQCKTKQDCLEKETCNITSHACETDTSCKSRSDCNDGEKCDTSSGKCIADTCQNHTKDETESDVDCGGTSGCGGCANDKACATEMDCASGYCNPDSHQCKPFVCTAETNCPGENGTCDTASGWCISCNDLIKNGSETDIDCGGVCKNKCMESQQCAQNSDCVSGLCIENQCVPMPPVIGLQDLVINEVMAAPKASHLFAYNDSSAQCEFVEIVNKSDRVGSLNGIVLGLLKDGDPAEKVTQVKLSGIIPANGVHVVHNCTVLPLPDDATYSHFLTKDGSKINTSAITNGKGYRFSLVKVADGGNFADGTVGSVFTMPPSKDGISYNLAPEIVGEVVVLHTEISSGADASPGYCSNGGLFSEDCYIPPEPCDASDLAANCGGTCSIKCEEGKTCHSGTDCLSGVCEDDKCTDGAPQAAELSKLMINEVMGAPKTGSQFAIQNSTAQCEFVEIVNLDNKAVSVEGITLELLKDKGDAVTKSIPLEGTIPANGVLVVSEKDIPMPKDGINLKKLSSSITNGNEYYIRLSDGTNQASRVVRAVVASKNQGKSQNRTADLDMTSETLVLHDTVSDKGYTNSPGYCSNGALFSKNCINDDPVIGADCNADTFDETCGSDGHTVYYCDFDTDPAKGKIAKDDCQDSFDDDGNPVKKTDYICAKSTSEAENFASCILDVESNRCETLHSKVQNCGYDLEHHKYEAEFGYNCVAFDNGRHYWFLASVRYCPGRCSDGCIEKSCTAGTASQCTADGLAVNCIPDEGGNYIQVAEDCASYETPLVCGIDGRNATCK